MIKKWLTRLILLAMILIGAYFIVLITEVETVHIKESVSDESFTEETIRGKGVRYKRFDAQGNELAAGSSQRVTMVGDQEIELEEGLELSMTREGRRYHFKADRFENLANGDRVMSAEPGNKIYLSVEGGIELITPGPLFYHPDDTFETEALANFNLGQARGQSRGLRYQPDRYLELSSNASLNAKRGDGEQQILASFIYLNLVQARGEIRDCIMTNVAAEGVQTTIFADHLDATFKNAPDEDFRFEWVRLEGQPASFNWNLGDLTASTLELCFDSDGQYVSSLTTSADSRVSTLTEDGYWLDGTNGRLELTLMLGSPTSLKSVDPAAFIAQKDDLQDMEMTGQEGFHTRFVEGKAYDTRLFGTPSFRHSERRGQSGGLRMLHSEHKVLFTGNAELLDPSVGIALKGDEILLTDWDLESREIYAFDFVHVIYELADAEPIEAWCTQLEMRFPERDVIMRGEPARLLRKNQDIKAERIEITRLDEDLFEIKTDDRVDLAIQTDEGELIILAAKMSFSQETNTIALESVTRASLPNQGEISCELMSIRLEPNEEDNSKRVVAAMKAEGNVRFKTAGASQDTQGMITCAADQLTYTRESGQIVFEGRGQDVTLNHPTAGSMKGRQLTYHIKDGTIRVDSVGRGVTTTQVNLKQGSQNRR